MKSEYKLIIFNISNLPVDIILSYLIVCFQIACYYTIHENKQSQNAFIFTENIFKLTTQAKAGVWL